MYGRMTPAGKVYNADHGAVPENVTKAPDCKLAHSYAVLCNNGAGSDHRGGQGCFTTQKLSHDFRMGLHLRSNRTVAYPPSYFPSRSLETQTLPHRLLTAQKLPLNLLIAQKIVTQAAYRPNVTTQAAYHPDITTEATCSTIQHTRYTIPVHDCIVLECLSDETSLAIPL